MAKEMLEALQPHSGGLYLDGTIGAGGYAEAILGASEPHGRVLGLDLDPQAVAASASRLSAYGERLIVVHGGFHQCQRFLERLGITSINGAVLDLGVSSDQLDDPKRGFSFRFNGPLDMRFDTSSGNTAIGWLETISVNKLEEILATYGNERYCKKLASGILNAYRAGELSRTQDLVKVVARVLGSRRGKIHPATRAFQAVRIAVNREMENLKAGLDQIPELLAPGARLCVVSYHSLEDRQVKGAFRERSTSPDRWKVLTAKPWRPTREEVGTNPRARSARMRVLEANGNPSVSLFAKGGL